MAAMKNSKTLIILVIALIAFNCAVLVLFWIKLYPNKLEQQQRPRIQGPAFEYLTQQLHLTKGQQRQYEKMREAHRDLADSLNEQSRMLRDSFFAKLKDTTAKPADVNTLGRRIAANTFRLDTATFFHFKRFRKILNPTQQQKFDDIIQDVLRMGSMPRSNGPGGAPPNGMRSDPQFHQQGPPPNGPHGKRLRQAPPFGPPPNGRGPKQGVPPPPGMPPPPPGQGPPPNGGPPPYGPPGGPPPSK
jgi:hypothetical protein